MTDKLPEIGKRYRQIATDKIFTCVSFFGEGLGKKFAVLHSENSLHHAYLSAFWSRFEEIPEDKPEIRKENPPVISELSEEVKQAMEDLKNLNKNCDTYLKPVEKVAGMIMNIQTKLAIEACLELINVFISKSKNLLDALDKQFGGKK